MRSYQIDIDGVTIEVLHKPIKHMHLRIYPPDGQVRVSAPLRLSTKHIQRELESKREWLHAQRARLQAQPIANEPTLNSEETHYFLGQAYMLQIIESPDRTHITLNDQTLLMKTSAEANTAEKQEALKRWYQLQMQSLIPALIQKWQPIIGVKVADWGIKPMKTRWGSCNIRTAHICLNLTLIHKPLICMEYVLVHEMIHLLEASHNARFYELMDTFMPDWRAHQKTLIKPMRHRAEHHGALPID